MHRNIFLNLRKECALQMKNTKSNITKFVLCLAAVICFLIALCINSYAAQTEGKTGDVTWKYNASTFTLTISGTGVTDNYETSKLPEWITLYKSSLKSVVVESGVTEIGNYTFANCTNLQTVTFASTVKSIGNYAFRGCTSLKNVTLPNNLTSIGTGAFYDSAITSIKIPSKVTYIGSFAFANNYGLTSVYYNAAKCTRAGSSEGPIFYNCPYISKVAIDNSVKLIPAYTFAFLSGISSVDIPESVTDIGEYAFGKCTNLSVINFNAKSCENAGSASYPAFSGCTKVITVNIGENVRVIPSYAFETLSQIKKITLPDSVTTIGDYAFYNCLLLEDIKIQDKVSSIGKMAFGNCVNIKTFNVPILLNHIGERAFYNCSSLTSLTLDETVTNIEPYAFEGTNKDVFTLNVIKYSYAHRYALSYGINASVTDNSGGTVVTPTTVTISPNYAYLDGKIIIRAKFSKNLTTECVHVAFYNLNGEVVEYMVVPLMGDSNDNAYIVTKDIPNAVRAKLLVWDSITTAKPISDFVEIEITRP